MSDDLMSGYAAYADPITIVTEAGFETMAVQSTSLTLTCSFTIDDTSFSIMTLPPTSFSVSV